MEEIINSTAASCFFPPVEQADEEGFLAWSEEAPVMVLLDAYMHGIFPWPCDKKRFLWFSLPQRSVLFLEELHIPHGLRREQKKYTFHFTVNQAFGEVIRHCARQRRPGQDGTWITPKLIRAYEELHAAGWADSFEAWDERGQLVGGLYGVSLGRFFAGESMFHRVDGASKFALLAALRYLAEVKQIRWIDTQVPSRLFEMLGSRMISRKEYLLLLRETLAGFAIRRG